MGRTRVDGTVLVDLQGVTHGWRHECAADHAFRGDWPRAPVRPGLFVLVGKAVRGVDFRLYDEWSARGASVEWVGMAYP